MKKLKEIYIHIVPEEIEIKTLKSKIKRIKQWAKTADIKLGDEVKLIEILNK